MQRIKFDLGELQAFVVTAEKASFRLAAETLCLSAPALSRRVERLEAALGVRLLLDQVTADLPEQPVAWYECNHLAGALALVEGGLGLAVLPQLALPPGNVEVCGVPLVAPDLWRTLGLLQRRDRVLGPAAQALRQRLLQS